MVFEVVLDAMHPVDDAARAEEEAAFEEGVS